MVQPKRLLRRRRRQRRRQCPWQLCAAGTVLSLLCALVLHPPDVDVGRDGRAPAGGGDAGRESPRRRAPSSRSLPASAAVGVGDGSAARRTRADAAEMDPAPEIPPVASRPDAPRIDENKEISNWIHVI